VQHRLYNNKIASNERVVRVWKEMAVVNSSGDIEGKLRKPCQ
jgi:hypothetical protein